MAPSSSSKSQFPDVAGRDVLILDDILDSGQTLATIREALETAEPQSIRVCVLFEQKRNNAPGKSIQIMLDSRSKTNLLSVTGSISRERYRNLPYIGVLRKELLEHG